MSTPETHTGHYVGSPAPRLAPANQAQSQILSSRVRLDAFERGAVCCAFAFFIIALIIPFVALAGAKLLSLAGAL